MSYNAILCLNPTALFVLGEALLWKRGYLTAWHYGINVCVNVFCSFLHLIRCSVSRGFRVCVCVSVCYMGPLCGCMNTLSGWGRAVQRQTLQFTRHSCRTHSGSSARSLEFTRRGSRSPRAGLCPSDWQHHRVFVLISAVWSLLTFTRGVSVLKNCLFSDEITSRFLFVMIHCHKTWML